MRSEVRVFPGPPLFEERDRGFSSVGRALALQARGHRFEPVNLHQAQVESGERKEKRSTEEVEMLKE